jgi:hypothetical protein
VLALSLGRQGNPLLFVDLHKVSVQTARAIIVLADSEFPAQSDARVLRVVLSLMGVHDDLKKQGMSGLEVRRCLLARAEAWCWQSFAANAGEGGGARRW